MAPEPAVSVVDRPTPGIDRTSDRGRLLGKCLAGTNEPIADPESFQPAASLVEGATTVLVGTANGRFVSCAMTAGPDPRVETEEDLMLGEQRLRSARAFLNGINKGTEVVVGIVPPLTERMEVRRAGGKPPLTPVVADGTFIAVLPADFERDPQIGQQQEEVTVALYNWRDELILEQRGLFPERD